MNQRVEEIRKKIMPVLNKYGVRRASIFGSVIRGESTENSDIDILVELGSNITLLDFVGLKLELEEVLGKTVDLGEYDTIKPIIRDRILKEQVAIL